LFAHIASVTSDHLLEDYKMGIEGEFGDESYYEDRAVYAGALEGQWSDFEDSLKIRSRYFSREAYETLKAVFRGLHEHRTHDGKPVIVAAGPDTEISGLYRARVFHTID
jgi:hypothetical protein